MNLENNKKTKLLFALGAGVVLAVILSLFFFWQSLSRITTDDAYIAGRIHSIASKVPGTALKVLVNDNQPVKKGDLLMEIDPADYQAKTAEDQAALEAENARLLDAQAGISTAMAGLEVQEIALRQAELDKNRAEALFKSGVFPQEKLEKSTTAYNLAVAQVKSSKEQLEKAKAFKGLEESLIKQREAVLKQAQLNVSYTKIFAPTDGYVTGKSVEQGNQVQAGQPLMAVVALNDIWVVANYKETELKTVHPGQQVRIRVDSYPGTLFTGKVESIMAGTGAAFSLFPTENALGNYVKVVQRIPVKITLDQGTDQRHILRVGMSCIPTIYIKNE
jgi:membrane fusion protein (multidrug efflux system)